VDLSILAGIDPDTLTGAQFDTLMASVDLSAGFAAVNALLEAAPARLRERLLTEFLGRLYAG
jgi:hypothetical protein